MLSTRPAKCFVPNSTLHQQAVHNGLARTPCPFGRTQPKIISAEECAKARDELLKAEKEVTHLADRVAAQRRRLPMVQFDSSYSFEGPEGKKTLLDLFGDQSRLALYQFMDLGPGKFCPGCTHMGDNIPEHALKQLKERGIDFVFASNMPLEQIEQYKKERGWTMPFYSSRGTKFTEDCGCQYFMLSMFMQDAVGSVYRTYNTTQRGLDRISFTHNIEDLSVYGRQEEWEDSPEGWPQHPTYG